MFRELFILVVLLLSSNVVFGQAIESADTVWVRRFVGSGDSSDYASSLTTDDFGNVYVAGSTYATGTSNDYLTIKYYSNGDTAWVRTYNGPGNWKDYATGIDTDDSGNVYVTGRSDAGYATLKYHPDGDTAWVRIYGPGSGGFYDGAYAIEVDNEGNAYVTGTISYDYATIKYYPNGDTAWVRKYNGPGNGNDVATAIAIDITGNVYVTGASEDSGTASDYSTIKYYSNGDTAWVRRYNGTGNDKDSSIAIALGGSGNVYVTGRSTGSGTDIDYVTIKYYSDGETAWVRSYNDPGNWLDLVMAMTTDDNGNVYVTGMDGGVADYVTIKYFPNGDTAWERRYNGPPSSIDWSYDIALDDSNNVYITGLSGQALSQSYFATLKYNPDGDLVWTQIYNAPPVDARDNPLALDVDKLGNIYITGISSHSRTNPNHYHVTTNKYVQFKYMYDTLCNFAYSPVDLIITDPIKRLISVNSNSIPGAIYDTVTDRNNDGDKDDIVTVPNPLIGEYLIRVVAEPGVDTGRYTEGIRIDGSSESIVVTNALVPPQGQADTIIYEVMQYLRGDANSDGKKTVSDVVFLINYLFKGGPAPAPLLLGDANCCQEGEKNCRAVGVSISDVVYLVNYLFKGGFAPCS